MIQKIIKSKNRVQKHGEVFTPDWMVENMLRSPGIKEVTESLEGTFLEPSVGEGNFLMSILKKKLKLVEENYSDTLIKYENYSLFALSTLYGVELLEDNAQICVINLYEIYKESYESIAQKYCSPLKKKVLSSAKLIISSNITQGNFLTRLTPEGTPIIFSEWKPIKKIDYKSPFISITRTEYSLEEIILGVSNNEGNILEVPQQQTQMSLFDLDEMVEMENHSTMISYSPCRITEVYNEVVRND